MNYTRLEEQLRKDEQEKIEAIKKDCEDQIRAKINSSELELLELEKSLSADFDSNRQTLQADFQIKLRTQKNVMLLQAEEKLRARIFQLIIELLKNNSENRKVIFNTLFNELPSEEWEEVYVSPLDRNLAAEYFIKAKIVDDDSILGGMKVSCDKASFTVDNTLQKRLARIFNKIAPKIIRNIYEKVGESPATGNIA